MMMKTVWTALVAVVALLTGGCSSKPPGCADAETTATARQMMADAVIKYMDGAASDDPDGWLKKFADALTVEIAGVVSEGYKADAKKQLCRGTLKVTASTGATAERAIEYSTQLTEDKKGTFLLEIEDFTPFIALMGLETRKYYDANRWAGTWNGTYECSAVGGTGEGQRGPFSMPVAMVVQGSKARLERTTLGGGYEVLEGDIKTFGIDRTVYLRGEGKNSLEDTWVTQFKGEVTGKRFAAEGDISVIVNEMRGYESTSRRVRVRACKLDVVLGAPASQQAPAPTATVGAQAGGSTPPPPPTPTANDGGIAGKYSGVGEGTVVAEIKPAGADGRHRITLSTSAGGCGGVAEGMASPSGSVLKFVAEDSGNRCNATLTVNGHQVVVDEGDVCGFFHGAACGFSATLNRAK